MAKKNTKSQKTVVGKTATDLKATVNAPTADSKKELVMEAKIEPKTNKKPKEEKKEKAYSTTCVITNTSQNTICLFNGSTENSITVAPREIKTVSKAALRELMKNKMVCRFFDKGILTSTLDAEEVSAHDAVAPAELKNPVERHEDGQNVKAEVKKFKREGSLNIELGE